MQVYLHALLQDLSNIDAVVRSMKIHAKLTDDRVFQAALAHIDLTAACRSPAASNSIESAMSE